MVLYSVLLIFERSNFQMGILRKELGEERSGGELLFLQVVLFYI